jgi:hypothetical protein
LVSKPADIPRSQHSQCLPRSVGLFILTGELGIHAYVGGGLDVVVVENFRVPVK